MAPLFATTRHVIPADRDVRAGEVFKDGTIPYQRFRAWQVAGRTAGLVGLGAVGRATRWRLEGLGMRVLTFDPYATDATHTDLDAMLAECDVVSMHAAPTPETLGMMDAGRFAAMPQGATYLNSARAGLHDLDALTEALASGHLGGAGLDHFEGEQLPKDHPLLAMEQVVLTPHRRRHLRHRGEPLGDDRRGPRPPALGRAASHCANPRCSRDRPRPQRRAARRGEGGGARHRPGDAPLRPGGGHGGQRVGPGGRRHRGGHALQRRLPVDDLDDLVVVTLDGRRWPASVRPPREGRPPRHPHRPPRGGRGGPLPRRPPSMSVAHIDIPAAIDEFIVYIGGEVLVCDYHPSGSDELAGAVAANLADRSATLMANHGLVCIGRSPDDALHAAKVVEHNAHIFWGARLLGGAVALPGKPVRDFTGVYQYVRARPGGRGDRAGLAHRPSTPGPAVLLDHLLPPDPLTSARRGRRGRLRRPAARRLPGGSAPDLGQRAFSGRHGGEAAFDRWLS
ncbi:MAG: NAD(P)-dependent oxidoreductase [Acidimicrobiales bacterium]